MLKDSFDQKINGANEKQLKQAIKFLLDSHASPVFGAAKTIEHEIAALNALQTLGYIEENADEYDLVEKLKITKTKARSLLYQRALRQVGNNESDINLSIIKVLENGQILREGNFYYIEVSDPLTMDRLRKQVRRSGYLSDGTFSGSVARLSGDALRSLVVQVTPKEQIDEMKKKLDHSGLHDANIKNLVISIFEQAAQKYAGEAGVEYASVIRDELSNFYQDPIKATKQYIEKLKKKMHEVRPTQLT